MKLSSIHNEDIKLLSGITLHRVQHMTEDAHRLQFAFDDNSMVFSADIDLNLSREDVAKRLHVLAESIAGD